MATLIQVRTNDELYHHGILGQKWGIRRYQNKDGSLTKAGERRAKRLEEEYNRLKGVNPNEKNNSTSEKKKLSEASDEEIRAKINNMNLQKQYIDAERNLAAAKQQYKETQEKDSKLKQFGKWAFNTAKDPITNAAKKWLGNKFDEMLKEEKPMTTKDLLEDANNKLQLENTKRKLQVMMDNPDIASWNKDLSDFGNLINKARGNKNQKTGDESSDSNESGSKSSNTQKEKSQKGQNDSSSWFNLKKSSEDSSPFDNDETTAEGYETKRNYGTDYRKTPDRLAGDKTYSYKTQAQKNYETSKKENAEQRKTNTPENFSTSNSNSKSLISNYVKDTSSVSVNNNKATLPINRLLSNSSDSNAKLLDTGKSTLFGKMDKYESTYVGNMTSSQKEDYKELFEKYGNAWLFHSEISEGDTKQMEYELYHHGVKGQRWGVRRYQNEDGTLTDKGQNTIKSDGTRFVKKILRNARAVGSSHIRFKRYRRHRELVLYFLKLKRSK